MSSNDSNKPPTQTTQGGEPPASTSQNTWGSGQPSTNTSSSTPFGSTPPTPAASTSSTSSTAPYTGLFSSPKTFSTQTAPATITPTTPTFGFQPPSSSTQSTQSSFSNAFSKPAETATGSGTTAVAPFGSSGSIGEKKDNTTTAATTPSFFGFDTNKKTGSGAADTSQKLGETTGGFGALGGPPKQSFGFANQSSTEKTTQSGFGFGTSNQASSTTTTAAPTPPTLFSTATTQPSLGGFNAASAPKSSFGALGTSNQATNTGAKPFAGFGTSNSSNQSSTGTTSQPGFSFGSLNQASFNNTAASTQPLLGAASTSQSFFGTGTASKSQFGGSFGNTGQSAATGASPFGNNFRPSSTSNLPASTSGPGLGIGSVTTAASTPASTSGGFGLGIGGTGSLGGAPKPISAPSPFAAALNKPGGLNTTTNSTGFNLPATASPNQNINLFSRIGGLPSSQATTTKPLSAFNTSTATTTSTSSIFPLSASTTLPSISATKPPSIIPQPTSAGFFQTTSSVASTSSQSNLVRPTLQTSASTISFPTGTATTTVGATTQSSVATTESIPTSSAWLKNSNIETIINRWKKDLDTSLKKFHSQASELREWDQKIIENSGRIVRLEEESSKADLLQSEIDSGLESIARRQNELEKMLSEYEVKFSEPVLDSTRPLDKQREKNYDMAEEINQELAEMSQVLSTIITDVNRNIIKSPVGDELNGKHSETLDQEDIEDPMDEVIKILNSHLTSLQWIDSTANQLTQNVQNAQQVLVQAQNELNIQQQQNGTNSNSG